MLLYRFILLLATPIIFVHLVWRALNCGEWRYFAQRIGLEYDDVPDDSVWIHCASVGEVKCVLPLLEQLHAEIPGTHFIITSNTATSRRIVQQHGADWITHLYCPIDWRLAVRSFLLHTRPACCYLFETELWPNLITACAARSIKVRIINGRISDNSMRQASWLKRIYAKPLSSVTSIHTRNATDRERYIALGASAASTTVTGDLKLAQASKPVIEPQSLTSRPYILVASTHEDEEKRITEACRPQMESRLLVIAPRHPERASSVAGQLHAMGLKVAMHSSRDNIDADTDVYIIDAIGLLDAWFPAADVVIMGGTFADIGGHNLIEPLAHGCAVIYGLSMHNFIEMQALVQQHDAAAQLASIDEISATIESWHDKPDLKRQLQQRAKQLATSLNCALSEYSALLKQQLQD